METATGCNVTTHNMPEDILWLLLAIANSEFIEYFYDIKFQNKLYANRRRFITQYVEQFPILNPTVPIAKELMVLSKQRYLSEDPEHSLIIETKINTLVWKAFGVQPFE